MKIKELLASLDPFDRERLLGRLEGMQLAQRLCRNRAEDIKGSLDRSMEAAMIAEIIRLVQVNIGNGLQPFPNLTADELDDIWRIY